MIPRLRTADEVAAELPESVTAFTVAQARRKGHLASVRVGRQHLYTDEQVAAWIKAKSSTPTAAFRRRSS